MKKYLLLLLPVLTFAQPRQSVSPPGLNFIREADLKRDVYQMADPHFRGRGAGTLDELKAGAWFAEKLREAGIEPAGDDGTYFQFFSLYRNRISPTSTVSIGDHKFSLWKDVLLAQTAPVMLTAPVLWLGQAGKPNADVDVKGKAVAMEANTLNIPFRSLPEWRYNRELMTLYGNDLLARGAVAVIFVCDEFGEHAWDYTIHNMRPGTWDIEGGPNAVAVPKPPVIWLRRSAMDWIQKAGLTLTIDQRVESFTYPSVNIIGKTRGTDPVLSKEYVLLSGHPDALGIRNVIGNDSIFHGADDNASVNMAMLAVIKALKKVPTKRSALIVLHGSEEKGLLGSKWFTSHPTVPLSSIAAVLNGDMIGRNGPDSAALLGGQGPHMNSAELAWMAMTANNEGPKFKLNTDWDHPAHLEYWYFRSDHAPYARLGIPSLMYTTLLHKDYHTPQDNAANINYGKLLKMTQWIYRTAWKVGNMPRRPATDPNFKLER
jgi:hypothetical protein